ncbi:hypothetical protein BOX15_Mlig012548g1 [Macrostomum lignano]|uniref:Uncharacterized protein n=1 Tax=Macrostomum lignano TaxID=282301 RepID=A0A267FJ78_9PLAT|nr:hypothetical protein BOX15_Mlig012548g1 [Macrostomum lignano]
MSSSGTYTSSSIYHQNSKPSSFGQIGYVASSSRLSFGILPLELDFSTTGSQASSSIGSDSMEALPPPQHSALYNSSDSINDSFEAEETHSDIYDAVNNDEWSQAAAPLSVSLLRQLDISPGIMQCMKAELPIYDNCDQIGATYSSADSKHSSVSGGRGPTSLRPLTVVRPRVTCLRYGRPLRLPSFT